MMLMLIYADAMLRYIITRYFVDATSYGELLPGCC